MIVDANVATEVFGTPTHSDFVAIIDWLTSPKVKGILVLGGYLTEELNRVKAARRFLLRLSQAGRARTEPTAVVNAETIAIQSSCESDDPHVIGLARVSGARILCSRDAMLHGDFKNKVLVDNPRGHVYQTASHATLLRKYGHTKACSEKIK
ncbi:MAG: hypothetical protein EXS05_19075 [Planctomycetaceae bacterium]|nr:hypothetical protein [Planctomycetaceae bacterium]